MPIYSMMLSVALMIIFTFGTAANAQQKTKILIITGGHDFERPQFFDMFASMDDFEFTNIEHPTANSIYAADSLVKYDVLVFYDMNQDILQEQKKAFLAMVEKGKGLLFLHHSLASYQTWDEYRQIQGGRYHLEPADETKKSTYKHEVTVNVHVVDSDHPVTNGLTDFTIFDEVYGNFEVLPTVHPLLKTDHPESSTIIGWANEYGNSRIVYLQPGHDHFAYENENYRKMMSQAIRWLADK